jgi:UDP-N-acetylglucosamine 2-epimerase (non-hydrolysing)
VLSRASLVMTDSGGIQEEAPTFGVPVLVLRDRTERQEGIAAGIARLVGTDPDVIVLEAIAALDGAASTRPAANPYGDGRAARRIVSILRRELALSSERDEEQTSPSEPKVSR